ncbi:MAG: inner-membrane translocator [Chloroflexi bacterium RBG_16_54_18]|nr:MAG: inner-membrane translocator [Chloroflexi bacterium RBG_16_54_18]
MRNWRNHSGLILPILTVAGLVLWPVITNNLSNREIVFTILKAIALASSLNILLGYTGYVSFGHIVFYGFGGYVGLYVVNDQGWSIWLGVLTGGIAAGAFAFLLGKAILRLRGAFFALATIGVNEAMEAFINNFDLFGGSIGITLNFSVYKTYGGAAQALNLTFYIMAALTFAAVLISYIVRTSKFGLGLRAIREDEDAAEIMGVIAPDAKNWAYVLSAIIPGMVGVLFFFKNGNVEPHVAFPLHSSIELLVMVMLGGQGTVFGPILGAIAYQGMRGYLLTSSFFKDIQLSVSGVLLLIIVLFIPEGAVGFLRRRFPPLRRILI